MIKLTSEAALNYKDQLKNYELNSSNITQLTFN